MGGNQSDLSQAEAASALRWWLESGVDTLVQEEARNWLVAPPKQAPAIAEAPVAPPVMLPEDLSGFRHWLAADPAAPLASAKSRPVAPQGVEGQEIMLLAEMPGREEATAGLPIAGEAWELAKRMLAAIALSAEQAYCANLSCFYAPATRLSPKELEDCAIAARRHVALAKPKRLLLLGDAPARALTGKSLVEARGHVHKIEGVRTVATFHPRFLLQHPAQKAQAWSDLLLLMEEEL